MSKIVKYKCDICGKEIDKAYMKIALPIPYYTVSDYQMGHNRTDNISTFNGEICKYRTSVYSNRIFRDWHR